MSKVDLEDVTLIGIDGIDPVGITLAVHICLEYCSFSETKILTPFDIQGEYCVQIPEIPNIHEYNRFVLKELYRYVDTRFVLLVQADGFILNSNSWSNMFLEYDYVAAPWKASVGGIGGFSLRSRELMRLVSSLVEGPPWNHEDMAICIQFHDDLLAHGIKFAPRELNARFAIDGAGTESGFGRWGEQFGFHNLSRTDISAWNAPTIHGIETMDLVATILRLQGRLWESKHNNDRMRRALRREHRRRTDSDS